MKIPVCPLCQEDVTECLCGTFPIKGRAGIEKRIKRKPVNGSVSNSVFQDRQRAEKQRAQIRKDAVKRKYCLEAQERED